MHRSAFVVSMIVTVTVFALLLPPSASANQSPRAVAAAGVDPSTGEALNQVTLFIGPADTGIAHTIAGGGSSDPDGDPLTYKWDCTDQATDGKCIFLLGTATNQVNFRPTFPPGTFDITLTVNDGQGHTASDSVRVKVLVDLTPPAVTPPDDESVSATDADGARGGASSDLHKFLFDSATATDNSTAVFTHLPPRVNGVDVDDSTLFPHGTTTVTFRIADAYGNVGTATADVFVTDLRSGDLFVGVQRTVAGAQTKGVVQRIRGGAVTDFCQSPDPPSGPLQDGDPVFWNRPDQIVVDSKGRVTFVAALNFGGTFEPSQQNGWGLLRCSLPGQPAEQLGIFPERSFIDPGWPEPLPGRFFYAPGLAPGQPLSGLHLRKLKYVVIDDNANNGNPQVVTDESYVFAYHESSIPDSTAGIIGSLSLNTESLTWNENDLDPVAVGFTTVGPQNMLPEMFFHSKIETVSFVGLTFSAPVAKTYATRAGVLRRIHQPFEVQLSANTPAGTVQFGVQAFGGHTDIPSSPIIGDKTITDDIAIPNMSSDCGAHPPTRGDWPQRLGTYSVLQTDGVIFERNSGLVVNSGFSMPAWTGQLDEALFDLDALNDAGSYFAFPEGGCVSMPVVNFTPLAGSGMPGSPTGYDFDALGRGLHPDRMAASPNGVFGTLAAQGRVVQATGALDLVDVATGLLAPKGLGAFPPQLGNVQVSALIVRVDSPVDVVLTDVFGRRLGAVGGQDVNEFGGQGHDTGPQTHPRLYIIQHPQAGTYAVRSMGTDSGPYTVHVYSLDSEKRVSEHILHSGEAHPGSAATHDFELSAHGGLSFANSTPVAHAGSDQTADADSSGNATFALDGSLSSDPDGDALTFTWAGPFGILSGAQSNARLGVGVHELELTVDDGKGGLATDTISVTVNGPADTVAPTATAALAPLPNGAGWNNTAITVAVTAFDNPGGSGVAQITYSISGAQEAPVTTVAGALASIPVTVEGISAITYFATDNAGNVENPKTLTARLDATAPHLTAPPNQTATQTSAAGAVVSYPPPTIVETGSGIASSGCVPVSGSVFPVGVTTVLCTTTDRADNRSSSTFTVRVNPQSAPPDGLMFGAGFVNRGGRHRHFALLVAQIRNHDFGRLEYWENGGPPRFFEATSIDEVIFSDDPGFRPDRGLEAAVETVDTVHFRGIGKWNGRRGYTFEGSAMDRGEPGRHHDTFSLVIKDAHGNVVNAVSGSLDGGNVQSMCLSPGREP